MSNSGLVTYTSLSPNNSGKRTHKIDRITPHCTVGQVSTRWFDYFKNPSVEASCNYGIGTEGGVALCVPEDTVSWCSSSPTNDNRAVTIECASDEKDPYAFNSTVYNKLIELMADICRRNGKNKVVWISDKNKALAYEPKSNEMLITVHRWFANKECPGDWLMGKMNDLASKVNAKLGKSITYRVHAQDKGWFPWVSDGACAGTTGEARRLEAIQIKSDSAKLTYQVHVQGKGDMPVVQEGKTAGTTGQSLRMEAIKIDCDKPIKYRVHVQNKGWMSWVTNGQWAGTKGQSLRMEAIEIKFA